MRDDFLLFGNVNEDDSWFVSSAYVFSLVLCELDAAATSVGAAATEATRVAAAAVNVKRLVGGMIPNQHRGKSLI